MLTPSQPHPEPRRPVNLADAANEPNNTGSSTEKQSADAPPGTQARSASDASEHGREVTGDHERQPSEQAVRISSLPAIDLQKDGLDWATFIMTFIVMGIAVWQIVLLRRSVISGERATAATEKSLDLTRLQQRAWVGPSSVEMHVAATGLIRCSIRVVNSGGTPAKRCRAWARIVPVTKEHPLMFEKSDDAAHASAFILHPGRDITLAVHGKRPLSGDDFAAVLRRIVTVYVYGRIDYADVFGRAHWSTFCVYYDPAKKAPIAANEHNDSDDEGAAPQAPPP